MIPLLLRSVDNRHKDGRLIDALQDEIAALRAEVRRLRETLRRLQARAIVTEEVR